MYDLLLQLPGGGAHRRRRLSDAASAAAFNAAVEAAVAAAVPAAGAPDLTMIFKKIQPGSIKKVTERCARQ
jgi:hypothetical protein